MRHFAEPLSRYLRSVRRRALLRQLGALCGDLVVLCLTSGVVGFIATALSSRGDVVRMAVMMGASVLGLVLCVVRLLRFYRLAGDLTRCARSIATSSPRWPPTSPDELVLRAEIRGAWDLGQAPADDAFQRKYSDDLRKHYVEHVFERARALGVARALPSPRWNFRLLGVALLLLTGVAMSFHPRAASVLATLWEGQDLRPLPPPKPFWRSYALEIQFPEYIARPTHHVENASGRIRVPAGSTIELRVDVDPSLDLSALELRSIVPDQSNPERHALSEIPNSNPNIHRWRTRWTIDTAQDLFLFGKIDGRASARGPRAPLLQIALEADLPPEIELTPPDRRQGEGDRDDAVSLRIQASDDHGLSALDLLYQLPDAEPQRLPVKLEAGAKRHRSRFEWDLSAIPIESRGEVVYWFEARDNDPGLGQRTPLDPPGKVTASAKYVLDIHDAQAEHTQNIQDLVALRDATVDILAARLTTPIFGRAAANHSAAQRLGAARAMHAAQETLLSMLAQAVDNLSTDELAAQSAVRVLAEIHERLLNLHRDEAQFHGVIPAQWVLSDDGNQILDWNWTQPADGSDPSPRPVPANQIRAVLNELARLDPKIKSQLEDEVIRIDDLVDSQILEQLEQLITRVQASQSKLVELLEQLKAGDESARPKIEQLEQRIALDMQRIREARTQLQEELGHEFVNQDAFRALEMRMRHQALAQKLENGDVDGALEQARQGLDDMQKLRDSLQDRLSQTPEGQDRLSPEAQRRMKLLRELSRLQDDQKNLQVETRQWLDRWREFVKRDRPPSKEAEAALGEAMSELQKSIQTINDARLGRDARAAYEKLRDQIAAWEESKNSASEDTNNKDKLPAPKIAALDVYETLEKLRGELRLTTQGAEKRELDRLKSIAEDILKRADEQWSELPRPSEHLPGDPQAALEALRRRQLGLDQRLSDLQREDFAQELPPEGKAALEDASSDMQDSGRSLGKDRLLRADEGETLAIEAIQRAIDSLRQSPPPPPSSQSSDSSTQAEQDRSLREQVMDAMKEREASTLPKDVEAYYEELLR